MPFAFNGGDTRNAVTDAQLTLASSGNGTAASPIVVMSYGTGRNFRWPGLGRTSVLDAKDGAEAVRNLSVVVRVA